MNWRRSWEALPDEMVLADARGAGWRRGEAGVALFAAGVYPACSLHGAMNAVGGGKWRCLVEGCNVGSEPPASAIVRYDRVRPFVGGWSALPDTGADVRAAVALHREHFGGKAS